MTKDISVELLSALQTFSKKHGLTGAQMESAIGDVALNSPRIPKGNVGIVTKDIFVVLHGDKNAAVIDGKRWEGKSSTVGEFVLTDGHRILNPTNYDVNASNLKILIYSPTEVRYIDLSTNTGGKYVR